MEQTTFQKTQQRIFRSPDQWQTFVDQFEASGLTQRAFCQQTGISYGTFSRWRRQLKVVHDQPPRALQTSDLFVEVSADATSTSATPAWDVELQLGRDVVLRLRHQPC
jgi:putative transposase